MEIELWKDIKGYEGLYQISSFGNVKSVERTLFRKNGSPFYVRERILRPIYDRHGYPYVFLTNIKNPKRFFIHRLVAINFIPNPNGKPDVDHIDGNPSNPKLSNLRWVTSKENHLNPITVERVKIGSSPIGKGLNAVAVIGESIISGETIYFDKIKDAQSCGFDPSTISKCILGKNKSHKGFIWKRAKHNQ